MFPDADELARVRASIDELLRGSRYGHFTDADRDRYRELRATEAALLARADVRPEPRPQRTEGDSGR